MRVQAFCVAEHKRDEFDPEVFVGCPIVLAKGISAGSPLCVLVSMPIIEVLR